MEIALDCKREAVNLSGVLIELIRALKIGIPSQALSANWSLMIQIYTGGESDLAIALQLLINVFCSYPERKPLPNP